jgi:glycosyltransferase involved in cell wall biosynthesis
MSTAILVGSQFSTPSLNLFRSRPAPTKRGEVPVTAAETSGIPLICFCHLYWDGVWQRPQQLLSRLALNHPVVFVETYCSEVASGFVRDRHPTGHPHVTVLEIHLPAARWNDGDFIDLERRRLLHEFSAQHGSRYERPILWFNDPMAVVAFAGHCNERAIVYDCMDELSQFKGAPANLRERERQLLLMADVVFCGGRKMREKRLRLNPNCHFYGTGVDCNHFGAARTEVLAVDPEIARLEGHILGYFGVIDERLDYELLATLADADPAWNIVMIGPTAKIDPADLPRRPNLHWLGPRSYTQLPAITKGFSVCLMPFALNAATEFINPTKALEYMASGRPVVSTSLDEVKTNFAPECCIAETHADFVAFCAQEAANPDAERLAAGVDLAAQHTWERTVDGMERHIYAAVLERSRRRHRLHHEGATAQPVHSHV